MMSAKKLLNPASLRYFLSKQGFATEAVSSKINAADSDIKVSRCASGLTVASVENLAPVSKVALFVNAGSRYETDSNLGVTHLLRNLSGTTSTSSSAFTITRNLEQIGANVQTTCTREHMIYSLNCIRDHLDVGIKYFSDIALRPAFKPWEVKDSFVKLQFDLATRDQCPSTALLDLLHKAAYRKGLGNTMYCPEYMLGQHNSEMLKSYMDEHYTADNMILVGMGLEHDDLVKYANSSFTVLPGEPAKTTSKYAGDEIRIDSTGELAYVAIVTEGASLKSQKDMLCLAVLQQALGTGAHVKWASNDSSRLSKAATKASSSPHAVSSINVNYSDSGLFGFVVAAQATEMEKVLRAVVGEVSGITKQVLSDQEVKTAKKQLKASLLLGLEASDNSVEEIANNVMNSSSSSAAEICAAIDALTNSEIMTVAKRVITGKPSLAAIGNLSNTPYLDQL